MTEHNHSSGLSRRSLARGAAWAVPTIAVLAAAPDASASVIIPPPPDINFTGACGNNGASQKGCGGTQDLQVPIQLTNKTGRDVIFQVTAMYTCVNCSVPPTSSSGATSGVTGVYTGTAGVNNACGTPQRGDCTGGLPEGSVLVPNGTSNGNYWIESASVGASSKFQTTIVWRMLDASTCAVLSGETAQTSGAIASGNC